jgi:hypothetical protein
MKFRETAEEVRARQDATTARIKAQQERGELYRARAAQLKELVANCTHDWQELPKLPGTSLTLKKCIHCSSMRKIDSGD